MHLQIRDSSDSEGTVPGATTSPNLHPPILDSSQYITLSDAGHHSTRMRCYFHYQCNHFIDCFDNPVPQDAVIYAGIVPFQHEQEGKYTKFFGHPTGYIFLAASRDQKFLSGHRTTSSHVLHTPIESRKSNCNYIYNCHSSSSIHMTVSSLDPSDPQHTTYTTRKRDVQVECLAQIKVAL